MVNNPAYIQVLHNKLCTKKWKNFLRIQTFSQIETLYAKVFCQNEKSPYNLPSMSKSRFCRPRVSLSIAAVPNNKQKHVFIQYLKVSSSLAQIQFDTGYLSNAKLDGNTSDLNDMHFCLVNSVSIWVAKFPTEGYKIKLCFFGKKFRVLIGAYCILPSQSAPRKLISCCFSISDNPRFMGFY